MGLLNYIPELDPNGQQVNRTAAMGNGVVNPGVPATEPVYYGDSADPKKKRKVSPWAILGAGLLGGVWSQHNPQGFDRAMGAIGQGLQRQQELELKRQQEQRQKEQDEAEAKRWEDDRISRENIAKGVANTRTETAADTAFGRLTTAFNTAYRVDPEGAIRAYGPALAQAASEAGLPWSSSMTTTPGILGTGAKLGEDVQRDKTKERLDWATRFGVGSDGTLNPGVPPAVPSVGSKAWLDTQTGLDRAANTAYTQGPKTNKTVADTEKVKADTAYTRGPRTALTTAQANRATTLLPSEVALKQAQTNRANRPPAPRGTGGKGGKGDAPADPNGAVAPRIYPNDLLANAGATGLPVSVASAIYSGYAGMFKKDSNGNIVRVKDIWTPKREAEMRAKFKAARQGKPVNPANTINTTGGMTGGDRASSGPQFGVLGGVQQMIDEARIVNSLKGPK
jgi:hypothetical protein